MGASRSRPLAVPASPPYDDHEHANKDVEADIKVFGADCDSNILAPGAGLVEGVEKPGEGEAYEDVEDVTADG